MKYLLIFLYFLSSLSFSQTLTTEISNEERNMLRGYGPVVVRNLTVNVSIDTNGYFDIEENYEVFFNEDRRGIIRFIDLKYILDIETFHEPGYQKSGQEYISEFLFPEASTRRISISNISVPERNFTVTGNTIFSDRLEIKIGDEAIFLSDMQHYTIKYRVENAFLFRDSIVDFYWNFLGGGWDMPFLNVNFNIYLQGGIDLDTSHFYLYGGPIGDTKELPEINFKNDTLSGKSPFILPAYNDLTVLLHLPENYIPKPSPNSVFWNRYAWPILPLSCLFIFILAWFFIGRDKILMNQVQYRAPRDIDPAMAGFLIDSKSNNRDLIALIPYWASLGILTIKETKKKSKINRGTQISLFVISVSILIAISLFGIYMILTYDSSMNYGFIGLFFIIALFPRIFKFLRKLKNGKSSIQLIQLKSFTNTGNAYQNSIFKGLFTGDKKSVYLDDLKHKFYEHLIQAKKHLKEAGLKKGFTKNSERNVTITKTICVLVMIGGGVLLVVKYHIIAGFFHALVCGILFLKARVMDKRTSKGDEIMKDLIGFRLFIEKAEKPKLEFLLKEDPKYFEETIAYAVAFGLTDKWCKKFDGLAVPPEWYDSSDTTFYAFGSSFNDMVQTATVTLSVAPPGSGGDGGSFGGGSSGGGFGGGGGSSW